MKNVIDFLITPVGKVEFFQNYFEKKPFVVERSDSSYYSKVLTIQDVEEALSRSKYLSNFGVFQFSKGKPLEDSKYINIAEINNVKIRGGLDKQKLKNNFFDDKCSISISRAEKILPKLKLFMACLAYETDCSSYANLYITPPDTRGFGPHFDLVDVFVLQIYGSKRWDVYESHGHLPDNSHFYQGFDSGRLNVDKLFTIDLQAGSFMYLPRGFVHDVTTTDQLSVHITIACLNNKWSDVILQYLLHLSKSIKHLRDSIHREIDGSHEDLQEVRSILEKRMIYEDIEQFNESKLKLKNKQKIHLKDLLM